MVLACHLHMQIRIVCASIVLGRRDQLQIPPVCCNLEGAIADRGLDHWMGGGYIVV
jgi:hypothetical protein